MRISYDYRQVTFHQTHSSWRSRDMIKCISKNSGLRGRTPLMLEDAVRRNLWRRLALHYSQRGRALKSVYFNATANCAYRETAELIAGHSGGKKGMDGGNPEKGGEGGKRAGPAFLGHVPMGIGISRCVNTSLSRRIEREQSETSTPAHCLRLGINKSIALGYGGYHGNRRPIRALSHSSCLSLSPSSFSSFLSRHLRFSLNPS